MSAKNNGGASQHNSDSRGWSFAFVGIVLTLFACSQSPVTDASSSGSTGSMDGGDRAGAPSTGGTLGWCEVQPIVLAKCGRCHGAAPSHGAPFPLMAYADTQVVDAKGVTRYERMRSAIDSGLMPAQYVKLSPVVEALTEGERTQLLDWLAASAPAGDAAGCE